MIDIFVLRIALLSEIRVGCDRAVLESSWVAVNMDMFRPQLYHSMFPAFSAIEVISDDMQTQTKNSN